MDWDKLVQLLVNGVTLGSVYALVALGFSMVYGILKLLNLAHGDVLMVGAFIGWGVLGWLGGAQDPSVAVWLLIVLMLLAAMVGCGFLGVAIERFAYRPLRRAPRIAPLISALGVSFFIQNSVLLLFGARLPQLRHLRPRRRRGRDQLGPAQRLDHPPRRHRVGVRDDGSASGCSSPARSSARRCARPRSTARPRR